MRLLLLIATLSFGFSSLAEMDVTSQLDPWAGEWTIVDSSGRAVGRSTIVEQVPGTMLFEQRTIGEGKTQSLWFENAERNNGWTQLFIGPAGRTREFRPLSAPGEWPIIMGSDVVLQDGTAARFRMTIEQISDDEVHRLLEISRDAGKSWANVFDYRYRRAK